MTRTWSNEVSKRLHQARIGEDIKQGIRTLSILENTSISDVTEQALRNHLESNHNRLKEYHLEKSRGF